MFKYCVLLADNRWKTLRTSSGFYPGIPQTLKTLFITAVYAQLYKPSTRPIVNIKFSLNESVKVKLSTVSTHPTITTTILKFNELVIIKKVGTA